MSAWERFASATPESQHRGASGLRDWPRSVVRWLLGPSEEDRQPHDAVRTGGAVPEYLHQPGNRRWRWYDRPSGRPAIGLESL